MAIYNPPKGNNWGAALQLAGTTTAGIGGVMTATGVGALPGIITGAVGGLMTGVGAIVNQQQQIRQKEYDQSYQARIRGEQNLQSSINNIRELSGTKTKL
jgi:hypothetical protein